MFPKVATADWWSDMKFTLRYWYGSRTLTCGRHGPELSSRADCDAEPLSGLRTDAYKLSESSGSSTNTIRPSSRIRRTPSATR